MNRGRVSYEALNQHRSEPTAQHRMTIIALHAIPEVARTASWVCNWNATVHRAAANDVDFKNRPTRGSVCNGLFK
jgi:hypothetical protein